MNQLERVIKRVTTKALMAFAKALEDAFGDESAALPLSNEQYCELAMEIEAAVEKTLREANIFPELQNGWPKRRAMHMRGNAQSRAKD